jgi:putative ABC transport system permease protein
MDGFVVAMTLAASAFLGILVGLVPIGHALTANLRETLWQQSRGATGSRRATTARHGLIVSQVALACTLLMGSLLLLASFRHIIRSDPGFVADDVITAAINLPAARYRGDFEMQAFLDRTLARVNVIPGVVRAAFGESVPLEPTFRGMVWVPEGYVQGQPTLGPDMISTTPRYLETLGMRLVRGRFLDERDNSSAPRAVLVDERLAARFWPDADAIGRRIYLPSTKTI